MIIFVSIYVLITSIFSIWCSYNNKKLYQFTKILPMIGLILVLGVNLFSKFEIFTLLMLIGIILGSIGDLFLVNQQKPLFFVLGLSSFALNHIFYISAFLTKTLTLKPFSLNWQLNPLVIIVVILLVLSYGTFLAFRMKRDGNTKLIVPVWIYILLLSTMVLNAMNVNIVAQIKYNLFIIAAILFFISDGLLSVDFFITKSKVKIMTALVLSTYYAAQCLFVFGTILK
ncbi:MAG: hypothetical protein A2Y34_00085 [Spirochaetes bacterium GWC1_27_15]|nr:MAG: hypothetical protein A2Z98_09865 [Spirochaetes bacterium GWB1_27_13]OHD25354.1 MAG: hypothetical protein A2Y34_00085 [Spirochaetes bacterium GWC1_27_15]